MKIVDSTERSTSTCLDVVWSGGITAQANGGCVKSAVVRNSKRREDITYGQSRESVACCLASL